jgi:hypothetical protein
MMDAIAVGADLADEEARSLQLDGGHVDRCRLYRRRFAEREAQFRQMRHLVDLAARRLKQDRSADPTMDITEWTTRGVGVERACMAGLARDVGEDRRVEPTLSKLAQHNGAEIGVV